MARRYEKKRNPHLKQKNVQRKIFKIMNLKSNTGNRNSMMRSIALMILIKRLNCMEQEAEDKLKKKRMLISL